MAPWSALLFATPIFGWTLTPPSVGGPPTLNAGAMPAAPPHALLAAPDEEQEERFELSVDGGEGEPSSADESSADETEDEGEDFGKLMAERQEVVALHKPLGIATWASMTLTMITGGIQYYNKYGFFDGQGSNPCVQGDPVFGRGQCTGVPWLHLSSALLTTALYGATFVTSLQMPAPEGLDEGDSDFAKNLRTHKLLRWVHVGGMAAQLLLGFVVANANRFGLDRANDYKTLQALSTVHMAAGLVTYGALSWAAALMVF